ncbi:hypothetical protein L3Q82_004547 [Scortum barcoo]|uniref:Uncharacterized protein n=1 Tax=Scortum barcoo TaxID=214431 RepID=A0ACB8VHF9_9TELE|nr:hypothetical protein L3Q82_004547 [Scortum barcoo]
MSGGNPEPVVVTEVRDAVRLKKESCRTMLACGTPAWSKGTLQQVPTSCCSYSQTVLEAKLRGLGGVGEAMEEDSITVPEEIGKPSIGAYLRRGSSTLPTLFTVQVGSC